MAIRELTEEEDKQFRRKWKGFWRELKDTPFLPRPQLDALQDSLFVAMVRHAYENVPMYRQKYDAHGVDIESIKSVKDTVKLPILEKDDLINNFPNGALARGYSIDDVQTAITGGSSGKVVRVCYSPDTMTKRIMTAYRIWDMMMDGYKRHHRQTYVYTSKYPIDSVYGKAFPLNFIWTLDDIETSKQKLVTSEPHMLTLYPSKLRDLVQAMSPEEMAKVRKNLVAVCVKSEMSTQDERDVWAKKFGVPVLDEYGSEELAGTVAAQCRKKGYHVWEDINVVEVVGSNNKPLPDGQLGEMVATNLYNWAMPIIRYRQGDLMALKPKDEKCECGRTFRMLEDFKGRANDIFKAKSGREFSPGYLLDVGYVHLIKYGDAMASWQLIQKDIENVEFRCTPTAKMTPKISGSIQSEVSKLLGGEFNVSVELVDDLILTPRGKRNQIISNLKRLTNG